MEDPGESATYGSTRHGGGGVRFRGAEKHEQSALCASLTAVGDVWGVSRSGIVIRGA